MPRRTVRMPFGRYLPPMGSEFVYVEALGGIVLLIGTVIALVWANADISSYADVWTTNLTLGIGNFSISEDARYWVNDGLMTAFFFVVGLEIKRELVRGELRDPRTASLPIVAAAGGMIAPAVIFSLVNAGGSGAHGWGVPMATDIAFAIAVVAILGDRVPRPVGLFLLTLAIVDDIGAIVVIALFYSDGIALAWLGGAVLTVLVVLAFQRVRVHRAIAYVLPGIVLWVCMFESGVHATLAGVVLGLLTPARPFGGREPIEMLEHRLHPWSSLVVVPLFALANAGILLDSRSLGRAADSAVAWGIVAGLVVGKPLGIVGATALARRIGVGRLPVGVHMGHVVGAGMVAGIGFTVSLFVADLSFTGFVLGDAKIGIVAASVCSAALGATLLARLTRGAHDDTTTPSRE
jgi:Na+:H+ antiporter, NhaA family